MHMISIDASPAQIRKLRKGLKVRIKKGTGFNLLVHPNTYNIVNRAFAKSKGVEVSLNNEEIAHNEGLTGALPSPDETMSEVPMAGTGFKSRRRTRGGNLLGTLKDSAKTAVEAGTERAVGAIQGSDPQYNQNRDTGSGLRRRRRARGGNLLGTLKDSAKTAVEAGTERAVGAIQGSDPQYNQNRDTGSGLRKHGHHAKLTHALNQALGTNHGYLSRANLDNAINSNLASQLSKLSIDARKRLAPSFGATTNLNPMAIVGGTLHEAGSVGRNGGMVSAYTPPALLSQPFSANWQLQFFLPPQYQHFNNGPAEHIGGSGLYL